MKIFAFAFALLMAGVTAVPDLATKSNERFVDNIIVSVIEDLIQNLQDRGFDPYVLEEGSVDYRLPVTDLLIVEAAIADVLVEGISNIRINRINFSLLTTRLQLDISLPLVSSSVGSSGGYVKLFSTELDGEISGSLAIQDVRAVVDARLNIGIISGISIRNLVIDLTIGGVESNLNVVLFGHNLSDSINRFLGEVIPNTLSVHRVDINTLLEHVIREIAERLL